MYQRVAGLSVLAVVILIAILRMVVMVPFGTVQLQTQFGALTGVVYDEGLSIKAPWTATVSWSVKTHSYETSSHPDESEADFTDFPVDGLTNDGQQVLAMRYTVLFSIPPECVIRVARKYGTFNSVVENAVKAHTRNLSRTNLGRFSAEVLASGINQYENAVIEELSSRFQTECVTLEGFLARKPDLDPDYLSAIEAQQIAQEAIQTAEYRAQEAVFEKQQAITNAEAAKERDILEAQGEAESTRLQADADAYSIQVKGQALEDHPAVLNWEFVTQLGSADYMILPDTGVTPLIPVPPGSGE